MHNGNYLCLKCFKAKKSPNLCCGYEPFYLGTKPRTPKVDASKQEWKRFIDMFVINSNNTKQQKRIITIRKQYGLPTLDQELKLIALETEHEETFGILSIKKHEKFEIYPFGHKNTQYGQLIKSMKDVIAYFECHHHVDRASIKIRKDYYIVPIHSEEYSHFIFPTEIEKFEIYKMNAKPSRTNNRVFDYVVKTNNLSEIINAPIMGSKRYSYTQGYLIFDDKMKALAFRSEYLRAVYPILKELGADYLPKLVEMFDIGVDRVVKKAPELLI